MKTGFLVLLGALALLMAIVLYWPDAASVHAVGPETLNNFNPEASQPPTGSFLPESWVVDDSPITRNAVDVVGASSSESASTAGVELLAHPAAPVEDLADLVQLRDSLREQLVTLETDAFIPLWQSGAYEVRETISASDLRDSTGAPIPNQIMFMEDGVRFVILEESQYPEIYALFRTVRSLDGEIAALKK